MRIDVLDLTRPHPDAAPLTYPRLRPWLDGVADTEAHIRIGAAAYDGDHVVGLALASIFKNEEMRLQSIMVPAAHRRRGVGADLIKTVEAEASARDVTALSAYFGNQKNRDGFRGLMAHCGWSAPEMLEFRLAGKADWTTRMGPDWARFLDRLKTKGYSTSLWSEITAEDRSDAEELLKEQREDLPIIFAGYEDFADPALSIAIRRHGKLVGFIIGQTLEQNDYHHYTTGYVSRPLQRAGWLLAGLDDVCSRQSVAYGPSSVAVYETPGHNPRMIEFMKRRLGGVTLWMNERWSVKKVLVD